MFKSQATVFTLVKVPADQSSHWMKSVALVLAHCNSDDVNSSVSPRDARSPLHLASSLGNLALVQLLIWVRMFSNLVYIYYVAATK